jgi:hypothetical protein
MDPNGRGTLEEESKIVELFAVSQATLTLVLQHVTHHYMPHFRSPNSATLANPTNE